MMIRGLGIGISRRVFLQGAAAFSATVGLSGCSTLFCSSGPRSPVRRSGIDVHAHVFNASDLPAGSFFQRVILHDHEDTFKPKPDAAEEALHGELAQLIVDILTRFAVLAKDEYKAITRGEPAETSASIPLTDRQVLRDVLSGQQGGGLPLPPFQDDGTVPVLPGVGGGPESLPGGNPGEAAPGGPAYLETLKDQLRREGLYTKGPEEAFLVDDIVEALLKSVSSIGRTVRWALLLLRSRRHIVDQLVKSYGGPGGIELFTPALVDFSHWLDEDDATRSPFDDQVLVMDEIQQLQTGPSMLHCFAPFNPLAQFFAEPNAETPLDLAKRAVMEHGFIGVKLYPPMGFFPINNSQYQPTLPERFDKPGTREKIVSGLDKALEELYTWCIENSVPVMAHATDSNAAFKGTGERANPEYWLDVLGDARFKDLHLNLGHFGDFEEAFEKDPSKPWEHVIGGAFKGGAKSLFADMSYLSEILGSNTTEKHLGKLNNALKAYIANYDEKAESLMYGSDWVMLGREPEYENYIGRFTDFLVEAEIDQARQHRIFKGNAVRFLGLAENGENRKRLEDYYYKHRDTLDADKLHTFDDA